MHQSALCNIWFGDNPNGIYGATPTDMHFFMASFCMLLK